MMPKSKVDMAEVRERLKDKVNHQNTMKIELYNNATTRHPESSRDDGSTLPSSYDDFGFYS